MLRKLAQLIVRAAGDRPGARPIGPPVLVVFDDEPRQVPTNFGRLVRHDSDKAYDLLDGLGSDYDLAYHQ